MVKLLEISQGGISVQDEAIQEKLQKKQLSPSLVSALEECSGRWLFESFVGRDIFPSNIAAERGSLFHRIMELFFALEPQERTREELGNIRELVLEQEDFAHFKNDPESLAWLDSTIEGYYAMGAKPQEVHVATYSRHGKEPRLGLEIFVKGKLGATTRDVLGFVDRLVQDPKNPEAVIVEDWKTGAKASPWNPKTNSKDGLKEARQQVIYSLLLRQDGLEVTRARLIYPAAKKLVNVALDDQDFNARVIGDLERTDQELTEKIENNLFDFKPSVLCAWCPLVAVCPRAQIARFDKARKAAHQQPPIEQLEPLFDFS